MELVSSSTWTERRVCVGEKEIRLQKEVRTLLIKEGLDTRKRNVYLMRWDMGSH